MKLKISIFVIIIFFSNLILLISQNLVPNPSFEKYEKCPIVSSSIPYVELVNNWFMPTIGTPDYFNECSVKAGVPFNWAGQRTAQDGNGYVGLIGRFNFEALNNSECKREYIQAKLIEPLEKDMEYCVKFYTVLSDNSQFAIDGIGAYLSVNKVDSIDYNANLNYEPQIQNIPAKLIYNDKWKEICGIYKAKGEEEYITIGNFKTDPNTRWSKRDKSLAINYSYYYVDNVSVSLISAFDTCNCSKELLEYNAKKQKNEISEEDAIKFDVKTLKIGQSLYLNSIQFVRNDQELIPDFIDEINLIIKLMNNNPTLSLKLSTYSDITIPEDKRADLIKARNRTVYDFIIAKGINPERLEIDENKNSRTDVLIEFEIIKL